MYEKRMLNRIRVPYVCVTFGDIVIIVIIFTRSMRTIIAWSAIRPRKIGNEREKTT